MSGGALAVNTYDDYGAPAPGNLGRYQFTGQFYLPEIGLYDYKARLYSPTQGRFMQTDPVGYKDGLNWYDYVHNDPVNKTDPSGMTCTGSGDKLECHIDATWGKPTDAQQKQEQAFNKAYTAAEKQLLSDPGKTVTLHNSDGKSFDVKAGDVASKLANTNVIADLRPGINTSGNMAQSNGRIIEVFDKGLAGVGSTAQQRQQDRETTIVHEGIHYGPGENSVYHGAPQLPSHLQPYDKAANELLDQGP